MESRPKRLDPEFPFSIESGFIVGVKEKIGTAKAHIGYEKRI
ncbi:hypothetical protein CAter282_3710 [Collimonas arenae]|uniref:Uncharacterized protein n=1 Tax=Collimonas arenae TaxID=279058 RepID=A0A127PUN8_9BURK|nr:hypothetical protein CAter10_4056 [Collimonas arenae]AMP11393.1 hypothetical protein CAter282_3710 [Collimonas arenae]